MGCTAGGSLEELRESQEKGLLNFLPAGAGAGAAAAAGAGAGGDAAGAAAGGLFERASVGGGDHGMGGSAEVKLLKDMVFVFPGGRLFSKRESVLCNVA